MASDTSTLRVVYRFVIQGCDDQNAVDVTLTAEEYAGVQRFAAAANASSSDACQPTVVLP